MGDALDGRVEQLEKRQDRIDRRINNVEQHQQELRRREAMIITDNQRAHDYAMKYISRFLAELNARSGMITSAIESFNKFMALPPHSSMWGQIFDFAFGLLAVAVPALRLTTLLRDAEVAISIAEKAEVAAPKMARALKGIENANERIEVINKGRETVNKLGEGVETHEKPEEAQKEVKELQELDPKRQAFKELNEYAKKGIALWERVLDLLDQSLENRLTNLEAPPKEPMLSMAQRLLKLPQPFTPEEMDQLELQYLWYLISSYCKQNVVIYRRTVIQEGRGAGWTKSVKEGIDGLNNTQQETLQEMFGPGAKRGKYFSMIASYNIYVTLAMWGVRREDSTTNAY